MNSRQVTRFILRASGVVSAITGIALMVDGAAFEDELFRALLLLGLGVLAMTGGLMLFVYAHILDFMHCLRGATKEVLAGKTSLARHGDAFHALSETRRDQQQPSSETK
jgi:hypothetical protein